MNCPNCKTEMNEIPEADPTLLRCPQCMTTIPKPEPKDSKK